MKCDLLGKIKQFKWGEESMQAIEIVNSDLKIRIPIINSNVKLLEYTLPLKELAEALKPYLKENL